MGSDTYNSKRHMGKILVDRDFLLFRPDVSYRINGNLIMLRLDQPIIFDCGTKNNPSVALVKSIAKKYQIQPDDVKYIVISHGHHDHFQNLNKTKRNFPYAQSICHEMDINAIKWPFLMPEPWKKGFYYKGETKAQIHLYSNFFAIFSNFIYRSLPLPNFIDKTVTHDCKISLGDDNITLISTPGHSQGHLCLLDNRKNLYLGDLVAFTPWIDPLPNALDNIINSVKKIMRLPSSKVERTIRTHGDIRIPNHQQWEISTWDMEQERFRFFLETIDDTLERIPKLVRGKEVSLYDLTATIIPHFNKYSKFMTRVFMPPALSWCIAYGLKLENEHQILWKLKKGKFYLTS